MSAVLVAAYSLLFGEMFLRAMAPQAIIPRFVTGTPLGIRGNIPGAVYRQWTPETEVEIRINSQGMRADREFAMAKTARTCRIALLGDSYFLGFENDLPDTIAGRLQERFDDAGFRAEVLNFAVSGFGTAEMLAQFEGAVLDFEPDVSVFQFHASDLRDNIRTASLFARNRDGVLERSGATYLPGIAVQDRLLGLAVYRWAIEHSHLYTAVRERAALAGKELLFRLGRRHSAPDDEGGSDGAEIATSDELGGPARLTRDLLERTRALAAVAGVEWYLLDIPTVMTRTHFVSRVDALQLSPPVAARVVSPLEALRERAAQGEKIFLEQGHKHMTPHGNRLVADLLFERLAHERRVLLSSCAEREREVKREAPLDRSAYAR